MHLENLIDKTAKMTLEMGIDWRYDFSAVKEQMTWILWTLPKLAEYEKHLTFACFSTTYLFYLDDVSGKHTDFYDTALRIHRKRETKPTGEHDVKKYGIVYYFEQLLQETLNPFNQALFHKDVFDFMLSEKQVNKEKEFSSLEDYMAVRMKNIGMRPYFVLLYDVLNQHYPVEKDHYFMKATEHIVLMNDLHSYIKEKQENESYNALALLQKKKDDIHGNVRKLLKTANEILSASYEIEDPMVREVVIAAQLGNVAWGACCERYNLLHHLKW